MKQLNKTRSMKIKTLVITLLLSASLFQASAQEDTVKIGYTNIELILAYLPETQQMEKELNLMQSKIAEQLKTKEAYLQQKYQELVEKVQNGQLSPQEQEEGQKQLEDLQAEIQKFAEDAEMEIISEREKKLIPLLDKLQNTIDAVADEGNYTYILNQTTSGGVSTILFGPEQNDVTDIIMEKLGIEISEEDMGGTQIDGGGQ